MLRLKALKPHKLLYFLCLHPTFMWARICKNCMNFCIFPVPHSGTRLWNPITPSQSRDGNFSAEIPPEACSQASMSTIILPFSGTSVPHVFRTPLSCANMIDAAGNDLPTPPKCGLVLSVLQTCRQEEHGPLKSVRWPSASQGTIWWLLPSQLGPSSSSWYKSCQAASTPRIFKHLGL